nr:cysteine-rich receptor-like protein kinase 2 [Ipomoea batatas]
MAGSGSLWWLAVVVFIVSVSKPAFSDPQTTLLASGCNSENFSNPSDFLRKLNASYADLGHQLSRNNKSFATTANPVYAMAQCRNYLSKPDCIACIDAAMLDSRSCFIALGATFIYDGCFIRYERDYFYDQITDSINYPACSKRPARKQDCIETITNSGCQACLTIAYNHMLRNCLPVSADGRAAENSLHSVLPVILPYIYIYADSVIPSPGSSGKKKAIGGVVGGAGIILVLAAIFLWYLQSKNPKASGRGNILGATQFRGSENYRYKDLKAATKDFSEENKLGEGGFGDVYKGTLQNGNVVAVKKLTMISGRAMADFETEVKLITNIHHPNLIRLLGYSGNREELLLVYEYMANASLDRYIYGAPKTYIIVIAWNLYENEEHLELVDKSLDPNEYKVDEVKRMLEIALVCTQSPSNLRPSMSEVMGMLSSIDGSIIQRPQNRPTIITNFDKRVPAVTATPTNATISLSEFSGR